MVFLQAQVQFEPRIILGQWKLQFLSPNNRRMLNFQKNHFEWVCLVFSLLLKHFYLTWQVILGIKHSNRTILKQFQGHRTSTATVLLNGVFGAYTDRASWFNTSYPDTCPMFWHKPLPARGTCTIRDEVVADIVQMGRECCRIVTAIAVGDTVAMNDRLWVGPIPVAH